MPLLSVVVPVYNRGEVIRECLKGIRSSLYKDYELIVVDCSSIDNTPLVARQYADVFIEAQKGAGRSQARLMGIQAAKGEIIVNVDSDVVIHPDTLGIIDGHFRKNPQAGALTGCLDKENTYPDFFSQYKNLYMHYTFRKLPPEVTFLYGSIYAFRRSAWQYFPPYVKVADDTNLGQQFVSQGIKISFLKELEVTHLKQYNFSSFIMNDFAIPFDWAKIFIEYRGWRQLGRNKLGFAHASKRQLFAVTLAPLALILLFAGASNDLYFLAGVFLILTWYVLHSSFFSFLAQEKGLIFACCAFFLTFLDNLIMASGITFGFLNALAPGHLFVHKGEDGFK